MKPKSVRIASVWVKFQSAKALEKAIKYLGLLTSTLAADNKAMQQTGREPVAFNFCRIGRICCGSTEQALRILR
jgi:hypothetical protein